MPIYEFQCNECKSVFEVLQDLKTKKHSDCPNCKSSSIRRLISLVQARFGKDFYEEEYKAGAFD